MTNPSERLESLLIEQTIGELTVEDKAELEALLIAHPEVDRYAFERVAAVVFLSVGATGHTEKMPASLKSRLTSSAERLFNLKDGPDL